MTRKETLERVADELRHNIDNKLDLAILTLVETLSDVGDGNITSTCGNIGISVVKDSIFLVNLDTGEIMFILNIKI